MPVCLFFCFAATLVAICINHISYILTVIWIAHYMNNGNCSCHPCFANARTYIWCRAFSQVATIVATPALTMFILAWHQAFHKVATIVATLLNMLDFDIYMFVFWWVATLVATRINLLCFYVCVFVFCFAATLVATRINLLCFYACVFVFLLCGNFSCHSD